MSNKDSSFKKHISKLIKNSEKLSKFFNDDTFEFPCTNIECPSINSIDVNKDSIAWKNNKDGYTVFCSVCGQDESYSKKKFKFLKYKFVNKLPSKKLTKQDPEYYDDIDQVA